MVVNNFFTKLPKTSNSSKFYRHFTNNFKQSKFKNDLPRYFYSIYSCNISNFSSSQLIMLQNIMEGHYISGISGMYELASEELTNSQDLSSALSVMCWLRYVINL